MGWPNSAVGISLRTVRPLAARASPRTPAQHSNAVEWALVSMRNPKPTAQKISFVAPLHNHQLGALERFGGHGEVRSSHIRLALTLRRGEKSSNEHNRVIEGSR